MILIKEKYTIKEIKKMWEEMIDQIAWRIEEGTISIDLCKYDMEALVRPFFGDDDEMYEYLSYKFETAKERITH